MGDLLARTGGWPEVRAAPTNMVESARRVRRALSGRTSWRRWGSRRRRLGSGSSARVGDFRAILKIEAPPRKVRPRSAGRESPASLVTVELSLAQPGPLGSAGFAFHPVVRSAVHRY
jgi:hypothetical protein